MMNTFSARTPVSIASRPCWTCIRNSPWIGMKYFGLVRLSISLSSSWLAWPETWARLMVWYRTFAPFLKRLSMVRATYSSLLGIGMELTITVLSVVITLKRGSRLVMRARYGLGTHYAC